MAIIHVGAETQFSGTVTAEDIYANSTEFDITDDKYGTTKPKFDCKIMNGCKWEAVGVTWYINGKNFVHEDKSQASWVIGVTFLFNEVNDQTKLDLRLKQCQINGRFGGNDLVQLVGADNVVINANPHSSSGGGRAFGAFLTRHGEWYEGIRLNKGQRLGGIGATNAVVGIRKCGNNAFGGRAEIGLNEGLSAIIEDFELGATDTIRSAFYLGSSRDNTVMMLGLNVDRMFKGSPRTLENAGYNGKTRLATGGHKYIRYIGGSGGKVRVYDSRSQSTPQNLELSLTRWQCLTLSNFLSIDNNDNVDYVVFSGVKVGTSSSSQLTEITNQTVVVTKFGYEIYTKKYADKLAVELTEGGATSYVPVLLSTEPSLTAATAAAVIAKTRISTLDDLFDYLYERVIDNPTIAPVTGDLIGTVNLTQLVLPVNWNLTLTSSQPHAITGTTITINCAELKPGVKFTELVLSGTGRVSTPSGEVVTAPYEDADGDSSLSLVVPAGYDHRIRVYGTKSNAESTSNVLFSDSSFRYKSTTQGGKVLWIRLTAADGSYIITSHTFPAEKGFYTTNLITNSTNAALDSINSKVTQVATTTKLIRSTQTTKSDIIDTEYTRVTKSNYSLIKGTLVNGHFTFDNDEIVLSLPVEATDIVTILQLKDVVVTAGAVTNFKATLYATSGGVEREVTSESNGEGYITADNWGGAFSVSTNYADLGNHKGFTAFGARISAAAVDVGTQITIGAFQIKEKQAHVIELDSPTPVNVVQVGDIEVNSPDDLKGSGGGGGGGGDPAVLNEILEKVKEQSFIG